MAAVTVPPTVSAAAGTTAAVTDEDLKSTIPAATAGPDDRAVSGRRGLTETHRGTAV